MTTTESNPAADAPDAPEPDPNAVPITINGREVIARKGDLIIKAAEDAGVYIPRFCYHERMSPVGMCRMCLCEVDSGRGPAVTVTCMVHGGSGHEGRDPVRDLEADAGGRARTAARQPPARLPGLRQGWRVPAAGQRDDATARARAGSSKRSGTTRSRSRSAISSSSTVSAASSAIAAPGFADEVAGDALIHFTHRGNNTQVLTFPDEPFSSYFSGNTVQICPVGALTAKPYRFKARPVGPHPGREHLHHVRSRSAGSSCSRARTSSCGCRASTPTPSTGVGSATEAGSTSRRPTASSGLGTPAVKQGDSLVTSSWSAALAKAAALIKDAIATDGPAGIAVIGGARGTNEDAYAWARLANDVIGTPNVYAQLRDGLPGDILDLPRATIDETAAAATIVLLGPDLKEELPGALPAAQRRGRQAAQQDHRVLAHRDRPDPVRVEVGAVPRR